MKAKQLLFFLIFITVSNKNCFAQTSIIYSIRSYPTYVNSPGNWAPIVRTPDGGYLLNYSMTDRYRSYRYETLTEIIKTDASLTPIWHKSLYDSFNGQKTFVFDDGSILLFSNKCSEGYGVGGYTRGCNFRLQKLDTSGLTLWEKTNYSTSTSGVIQVNDAFLKDGNTLKLAGTKMTDNTDSNRPVIMDFDLNGNFIQGSILIDLSYESDSGSIMSMCKETSGNYYALVADLDSKRILKMSPTNTILWSKRLNFTDSNHHFYDIELNSNATLSLNNGDILIGANYYSGSPLNTITSKSILLLRINSSGNLIWSKILDTYGFDIGDFKELSTNEIIVTGIHNANDKSFATVFKINAEGNLIWSKKYSPAFSIGPLYEKSLNEWYFTAYGLDDRSSPANYHYPLLFSTDSSGNTTCNAEDLPLTILNKSITLETANYSITPLTLNAPTVNPGYAANNSSLTYSTNCPPLMVNEFENRNEILLYPNPNHGLLNIESQNNINKIQVHNLLGQQIMELTPKQSSSRMTIENSGIYFIKVETDSGSKVFKVIVNK